MIQGKSTSTEYINGLEIENRRLKDELATLRRMVFGQKSEKTPSEPPKNQTYLFQSAEIEAPATEDASETITYKRKKPGHGRQRIAASIERVEETLDVPESERQCSQCGEEMAIIGEETSEVVEYVPAKVRVRQFKRIKRACRSHAEEGVRTAPKPVKLIDKGLAGPSIVSNIICDKYVNHLPIERQLQNFSRLGLDLQKSTVVGWLKAMDPFLEQVDSVNREGLRSRPILYSDDTPLPVQDKDKKGSTSRGFAWTYSDGHSTAILDYTRGRSREGPNQVLENWQGYLHTDAYSGYNALHERGVKSVFCWAHARRKFFNAAKNRQRHAWRPLQLINRLFMVERYCKTKKLSHADRKAIRNRVSSRIVDQVYKWCNTHSITAIPENELGKAIEYLTKRKEGFSRFLENDALEIDNNHSERNLRSLVLGRKNWMFAGSHEAATRACRIFGMVTTCKLLKLDPYAYFNWALAKWSLDKSQPAGRLTPHAFASL